MKVGGCTVGTELDFDIMADTGMRKLTEKQAIDLIKKAGLKFRRYKVYKSDKKPACIKPIGNKKDVYDFLEECLDNRIFIFNEGIKIK